MLFAAETDGWTHFAEIWGPAVPIFLVFVFYVHRLVFRVIPRGFHSMRKIADAERQAQANRHEEAMGILRAVKERLDKLPLCRNHPPSKRKKPAG